MPKTYDYYTGLHEDATLVDEWFSDRLAMGDPDAGALNYITIFRRLRSHLGRSLEDATSAELKSFVRDQDVSAATKAYQTRVIKSFYKWMVDEEFLDASPAARLKAPTVKLTPVRTVDDEYHQKLVDSIKGSDFYDKRDRVLIELLKTGARIGEIAAIQIEDIDLDNLVIRLGKSKTDAGSYRLVAIDRTSAKAIRRMFRVGQRFTKKPESGPLLTSRRGDQMTSSGAQQIVKNRCDAAGLERRGCHAWRRRAAEKLIERTNVVVTATLLGWSASTSQQMAACYSRMGQQDIALRAWREAFGD